MGYIKIFQRFIKGYYDKYCPLYSQIVLAGDPMQLGPVLRSKYSIHYGLQYSYLERLMCRQPYLRDEVKFVDHGSYDPLLVRKKLYNRDVDLMLVYCWSNV